MANNRMFIGCKLCGECCFIGKWYPGGPWYANNPIKNGEYMYKFFEDHDHHRAMIVDNEETFEIVYESNKTLQYTHNETTKAKPTYIPNK